MMLAHDFPFHYAPHPRKCQRKLCSDSCLTQNVNSVLRKKVFANCLPNISTSSSSTSVAAKAVIDPETSSFSDTSSQASNSILPFKLTEHSDQGIQNVRNVDAIIVNSKNVDIYNEADGHVQGKGTEECSSQNTSMHVASSLSLEPSIENKVDSSAKRSPSLNLLKRVSTGLALGALGAVVILAGKWPFLALILFVTYHATQEYYGFMSSKGMTQGLKAPPPLVSSVTTVMCVSIALFAFLHKGRLSTILAVCAFILLVMGVVTEKRPKFSQLATSVFGLFYCGWLPSFWVKLRMLARSAPASPVGSFVSHYTPWTVGLVATWSVVCCVIAADVGAYFVGKNLGRTKLTDISPKKTVEGAAGGCISSMAMAVGLQTLTGWPTTQLAALSMGALTFVASLFGDLIESIMKRDAGMKDSGSLIPGHGGMLDRFDSYMFTGAMAYFFVVYVVPRLGL